jgi:hypothetical protein
MVIKTVRIVLLDITADLCSVFFIVNGIFICLFILFLLFICVYNVWVISPSLLPHYQAETIMPLSLIFLKREYKQ